MATDSISCPFYGYGSRPPKWILNRAIRDQFVHRYVRNGDCAVWIESVVHRRHTDYRKITASVYRSLRNLYQVLEFLLRSSSLSVFGGMLWIAFEYLVFGRHLYVLGDNPKAAELVGISSAKYITGAFVISGFLAAMAGIILQAQLRTGESVIGAEFLLPAFTAVLLGATSVRPGRANVLGTLLATAALGIVVTGLGQLGVPFFVEPVFNGVMLVVSVGLSVAVQKSRDSRSSATRVPA